MKLLGSYIIFFIFLAQHCFAQERTAPLRSNPAVQQAAAKGIRSYKKTALNLPFFEDFTTYNIFPDPAKWVDHQVYVNNTMCINPISRGVATLDALNQIGLPYDSFANNSQLFCDSLTSQPIDLSVHTPADSVYLSFFYQPGGNGFYPLTGDSLMLFFRQSNGDWVEVWSIPGSTVTPFTQVMVPIIDTGYFNAAFQFRFVNLAAFNYSGSTWNVDYIRMNAGRSFFDTAVNDVAYTSDPANLLNDYTSMPYRQFLANKSAELSTQLSDSIRNNYSVSQNVSYGYQAHELKSGTLLGSGTGSTNIPADITTQVSFPTYTATTPIAGADDKVVFENKFYLQSIGVADSRPNDTCVYDQVFDNYLSYDDGTAESAYYLNLSATLPGKIAIEYHLNQPDTMRGMAIYFGRQVPLAGYKNFSIVVYKSLAGVSGAYADTILRQQDLYAPSYMDTINHFWIYRLDTPVVIPHGIFYAGIIQPAYSASDSLYFGLDVNRKNGNHAYYSVLNVWNSSLINGAIMMRPLFGQYVVGTGVTAVLKNDNDWDISPNPAKDVLHLGNTVSHHVSYELMNIQGSRLMMGNPDSEQNINISNLVPGMYFIRLSIDGVSTAGKKFIKQ